LRYTLLKIVWFLSEIASFAHGCSKSFRKIQTLFWFVLMPHIWKYKWQNVVNKVGYTLCSYPCDSSNHCLSMSFRACTSSSAPELDIWVRVWRNPHRIVRSHSLSMVMRVTSTTAWLTACRQLSFTSMLCYPNANIVVPSSLIQNVMVMIHDHGHDHDPVILGRLGSC